MRHSRLILTSLISLSVISWGGIVPPSSLTWGQEDGITDIIPSTSSGYFWYPYGGGLNNSTWDKVALAVASLDNEVTSLRWLPGSPSGVYTDDQVLVSIGIKNDTVPPECSDTEDDPSCVLGITSCVSKINNTVPGQYDVCRNYRVYIYWSRIVANTAAKYPDRNPLDVLYGVVRHELTHVMGFRHGSGGPMESGSSTLTSCQVGILSTYQSDFSGTEWSIQMPETCYAQ